MSETALPQDVAGLVLSLKAFSAELYIEASRDWGEREYIIPVLRAQADQFSKSAAALIAISARNAELEAALRPFAEIPGDTRCNDGCPLEYAADTALACGINLPVTVIRQAALAMLANPTPREKLKGEKG